MAAPQFKDKLAARRKFIKGQVNRTLRPSALQGVNPPKNSPIDTDIKDPRYGNTGTVKPSGGVKTPGTKPLPKPMSGNTGPFKPGTPGTSPRPPLHHVPPVKNGPKRPKNNPVRKVATSSYTFKKGDTLSSVAKSKFGDASIWHRIVNHNPNLKGMKPGDIKAGTKINLPSYGNKYRRHLSNIHKRNPAMVASNKKRAKLEKKLKNPPFKIPGQSTRKY